MNYGYVLCKQINGTEVYYTSLSNWRNDLQQAVVYGGMTIDERVRAMINWRPDSLVYKKPVNLTVA